LLADIGLIAHGPNRYGIYIGGDHATQQIAQFTGREFAWGEELKEYLRDLLLTHR
jgi:sulfite reductase beta subunit-like hemoprotein